uniref:Uncharacterized protein n=1 Tax=Rangifer tarandus platyrhynchus TaxID=3082113 RepID=A0ACB0F7B9_RANTA|nr:unnamed protein product [Rangifer tarandus platyrhynchus]
MMLGASCDGATSEVSKPEKDVEPDAEIARESVHGIDAGETAPPERPGARLLEHFCSQLRDGRNHPRSGRPTGRVRVTCASWRPRAWSGAWTAAHPRGAHAVHAPFRIPHRGNSMWCYLHVDAFSGDDAQRQSQLL